MTFNGYKYSIACHIYVTTTPVDSCCYKVNICVDEPIVFVSSVLLRYNLRTVNTSILMPSSLKSDKHIQPYNHYHHCYGEQFIIPPKFHVPLHTQPLLQATAGSGLPCRSSASFLGVSQKWTHTAWSLWAWLLALGRKRGGAFWTCADSCCWAVFTCGQTTLVFSRPQLGNFGVGFQNWEIMKKAAVNIHGQALCEHKFSFLLIEPLGAGSLVPTVSTCWLCKTVQPVCHAVANCGGSPPHQLCSVQGLRILTRLPPSGFWSWPFCRLAHCRFDWGLPSDKCVKHLFIHLLSVYVFGEVSVQISSHFWSWVFWLFWELFVTSGCRSIVRYVICKYFLAVCSF